MKRFAVIGLAILGVTVLFLSAVVIAQSMYTSDTPAVQPLQSSARPCPKCGMQGTFTEETVTDTHVIYYIYICPKGHVWRVPM